MNILVDTHILIWAAATPKTLQPRAQELLFDGGNTLYFSFASVWEIGIKATLQRSNFDIYPRVFSNWCKESDIIELPLNVDHVEAVMSLPLHHRDPFDRIMVAQARVENMKLLTHDRQLAQYGSPVEVV